MQNEHPGKKQTEEKHLSVLNTPAFPAGDRSADRSAPSHDFRSFLSIYIEISESVKALSQKHGLPAGCAGRSRKGRRKDFRKFREDGTKHHIRADKYGHPLSIATAGADQPDGIQGEAALKNSICKSCGRTESLCESGIFWKNRRVHAFLLLWAASRRKREMIALQKGTS